MKKIILILIYIFTFNTLIAQDIEQFFNTLDSTDQEWASYDIDSLVAIDIPGEVYDEEDTTVYYEVYSNTEMASFIIRRSSIESIDSESSILPHDLESLKSYYEGLQESLPIPHDLGSTKFIHKGDFLGYELIFIDHLKNPIYRVQLFQLNEYLYSFYYVQAFVFKDAPGDVFFNSMVINPNQEISQFLGSSPPSGIMSIIKDLMIPVLLMLVIILGMSRKRKTS